jgi:hypothetical protein
VIKVRAATLFLIIILFCTRAEAADDTLYESAKKEGEVVWYTSLIVNQAVRPLIDAFNKKIGRASCRERV